MKTKRLYILLALLIVTAVAVTPLTHAQTPGNLIPSDLSLDLQLARQNPAPGQQQILQSETKRAIVVHQTGLTTTVIPEDTVAEDVKTQTREDTLNPEQTTSEQVVTKEVEVEVNDQGTPIPTQAEPTETPEPGVTTTPVAPVLVPGTDILEPNDNAASANNSENPNLPAPTSADNQPTSAPTGSTSDQPTAAPQGGTSNTQPVQQQTIPQESQQIGQPPAENPPAQQQPAQQPSSDQQQQQQPQQQQQSNPPSDSGSGSSGGSSDSQPQSDSVQGIATGPVSVVGFLKQLKQQIVLFFSK